MSNLICENNVNYEFITTGDGSPSIRMSSEIYRPEAMHHSDGALAESLYIYHGILKQSLEHEFAPYVLSVGLGCAYNEIITAAHFLKHVRDPFDLYLESFEGDDVLRNTFQLWLTSTTEQSTQARLQSQLFKTYDQILKMIAESFSLDPIELKSFLFSLYKANRFVLRDWLTTETKFHNKFGVIYFDAFSKQSTPDIWTDEFLIQFLNVVSADGCGLATYAATGSLNRALKSTGFVRLPQSGFSGKRESTRAIKQESR